MFLYTLSIIKVSFVTVVFDDRVDGRIDVHAYVGESADDDVIKSALPPNTRNSLFLTPVQVKT